MDEMQEASSAAPVLARLRCEYMENPLGIAAAQPRLSWQIVTPRRAVEQTAYQVQVADSEEDLTAGTPLLWDSGIVRSSESVHRVYAGPALRSAQRCYWRVRVWDGEGRPSGWSSPAWWEMGLLSPDDWRASWIEPDWAEDPSAFNPCPYLRRVFTVPGRVKQARLYVTCHGVYELWLNGRRVGDQILAPGCTSYHHRLQYQTYDAGELLAAGENVLGAILGDGWYRGSILIDGARNVYGTTLALLAQLHIVGEEGGEQWVVSDKSWQATTGPILKSDLKDGETYDARREMPGWDAPGFDAGAWRGVRVADYGKGMLVAPVGPPARRKEEFSPVAVIHTPAGQTVLDMGQNIAGVVRMQVQGPAGTTVTLQHGEALDAQGNFSLAHLQPAGGMGKPLLQQDQYTLKGKGLEVYEPRFTVHGFRYVDVRGYPGPLSAENFRAVAIYSDMAPTGTFECSNMLLNRLQSNIAWSQKGNFLGIPTDCPTRERAGWTGDAQIFVRTGSFILDTAGFFSSWMKDVAAEQYPDGKVRNIVPSLDSGLITHLNGSAGWGDAAVIIPWTIYQCFGDRRILEEQYDSMAAWTGYMTHRAHKTHWSKRLSPAFWLNPARRSREHLLWDTNYHWGEWLEPGVHYGPNSVFISMVRQYLFSVPSVATAYYAYSTRLLAEIAAVLGREEDARRYRDLAARVKDAYVQEFVRADGTIRPHTQASYVRALAFDLLPDDLRRLAVQHLVRLIRANGNHLGTGFLSTPFLCHVLSQNGCLDLAYDLLNQDTRPSWLYPVKAGATTIWEMWDGIKEDGTVQGSLNHYAYGAVGSWLYQVVAGIELDPQQPGYKHILIQPQPGGGLSSARVTYQSMYGEIGVSWERFSEDDGRLRLAVTIPPNTRATVRIPAASREQVTESGQPLSRAAGIAAVREAGGAVLVDVGSGRYVFESGGSQHGDE